MKQMEEFKQTAEFLQEKNVPVFVVDIFGNYYFGYVVIVGDIRISIDNIEGKRKGERSYILWSNVKFITDKKENKEGGSQNE